MYIEPNLVLKLILLLLLLSLKEEARTRANNQQRRKGRRVKEKETLSKATGVLTKVGEERQI